VQYLNQTDAQNLDVELMGHLGFSIDQLMELAGLSVACAVYDAYPINQFKRILVICGPGSNFFCWVYCFF
jgi:NAD(P)H-hydrate epimerase